MFAFVFALYARLDDYKARPDDVLFLLDPANPFLVDVEVARNLSSLGDNFE